MNRLKKWWYFLAFDATKEYGRMIPYTGRYDQFVSDGPAADALHNDARMRLPEGLYYELRGTPIMDYGRMKAIAWCTHPGMWARPEFRSNKWYNGYWFVGGFLA